MTVISIFLYIDVVFCDDWWQWFQYFVCSFVASHVYWGISAYGAGYHGAQRSVIIALDMVFDGFQHEGFLDMVLNGFQHEGFFWLACCCYTYWQPDSMADNIWMDPIIFYVWVSALDCSHCDLIILLNFWSVVIELLDPAGCTLQDGMKE